MRGRLFDTDDERFELLRRACAQHTGGRRDDSQTVLACWDSDRLDLARAGIRPDPRLLGTAPARDLAVIDWASRKSVARHVPEFVAAEWAAS
jgi:uncharacterized protein